MTLTNLPKFMGLPSSVSIGQDLVEEAEEGD